ncbi:uncharacterized protein LOC120260416 [Dioscorea cayenensis subsp. rotundata]|uniref:Uncharacterized protein LOC120260416 n=1 Tax=Dioscorea cayennensis subsp. rotundata TaxID=55577 RepID=A0AB40B964_DIOCR|nr:uncharacterized protein LOC120260416 [Dioscorea cayenensis subsp. rotundata]
MQPHYKNQQSKEEMAASFKIFLASLLLLLSICSKGNCQQCEISSISVKQTNMGQKGGFDFQFEVEVKNLCNCAATSIFVKAPGFASSSPVDPKLFRLEGNNYIVNDGKPISSSSSMKFTYSWDHYFPMSPLSFNPLCK